MKQQPLLTSKRGFYPLSNSSQNMTSSLPEPLQENENGRLYRLQFSNRYDELSRVSDWLNALLLPNGFSAALAFQTELVLTEALTNVFDHAFEGQEPQRVVVEVTLNWPTVDAKIIDRGRPFNPLEDHVVDFPNSLEEAGSGGLGVHLIKSYAANCSYQREQGKNVFSFQLIDSGKSDQERFLSHRLFKGIPPSHLKTVFRKCSVMVLQPKDVLLSPGKANHYLYLLLDGKMRVYFDVIGSDNGFTINPGEYTGEMSIIDEEAPSAFVVAETVCRVLQMHQDVFWQEIASYRSVMRNMLHMFSQRMRTQIGLTLSTLERQLRYEHLQKELEAAGKIQANILPQMPLFPENPQVDVWALMTPAREVGGDFYDAFPIDDVHICLAIGDVSGKGMPSALFMVRVMTLLRMSLLKRKNFKSVASRVNDLLIENNAECNFVTLFLGMLNVENGRFQYVNGGHHAPYIARSDSPYVPLEMPRGALLGFSTRVQFEMAEIYLGPGDTLLLYTDGVTEAENKGGEFFSEHGIKKALAPLDRRASVHAIVERLHQSVVGFAGNVPQSDDITLVAMRYLGSGKS